MKKLIALCLTTFVLTSVLTGCFKKEQPVETKKEQKEVQTKTVKSKELVEHE